IRRLNQGWGSYFKLSESRSIFEILDEWTRSRVRLCYWSQWKRIKTRVKELKKLGVTSNQAYQWGNTRKGPWRTVNSPILKRTLTNAFLKKEGLLYLTDIIVPKTVNV
uniref:group II intron maturase-specific domain-containing protein n=1 Tax=Sphingobacterium composti TaxID=363260 RepID=UPI00293BA883